MKVEIKSENGNIIISCCECVKLCAVNISLPDKIESSEELIDLYDLIAIFGYEVFLKIKTNFLLHCDFSDIYLE